MKKQLRNKNKIYVNKNTYLVKINKQWKVAHKSTCESQLDYENDCEGVARLSYLKMRGIIK